MTDNYRNCPACGNTSATFLFRPSRSPGPVGRCPTCSMIYITHIEDSRAIIDTGPVLATEKWEYLLTSNELDDIGDCWELAQLPSKETEWPALRANALDALDHIESFLSPPGRLLDLGCGWGFFLGTAAECGWEIYGLEPLPGHAVYARAQFGAKVITDILRDDTFPADFFDVVTSYQVFEHLPQPAAEIRRIFQALRSGGVILIEVPDIDTWGVKFFGKRHRHFVVDHLNFFSAATLTKLLEQEGFEVLQSYHPTRRMSIRHLAGFWGRRYLPTGLATPLEGTMKRIGMWDNTIAVNLGDIVAVLAKKPE